MNLDLMPGPASQPAGARIPWSLPPWSIFKRGAYSTLIALILLDLLFGPFLVERGSPGSPLLTLLVFIVLFSILISGSSKKARPIICGVFLPVLLLDHWMLLQEPSTGLRLVSLAGKLLICIATQAAVVMRLHQRTHATLDALLGAVCVYLLIGYDFYLLYDMLELIHPGSFLILGQLLTAPGPEPHLLDCPQLLYFSFVTLTTLGYGDIAPTWSLPRSLVVIEALISQLFTAILFSILVSSYMANSWSRSFSERRTGKKSG